MLPSGGSPASSSLARSAKVRLAPSFAALAAIATALAAAARGSAARPAASFSAATESTPSRPFSPAAIRMSRSVTSVSSDRRMQSYVRYPQAMVAFGPFEEFELEVWRQVQAVNVESALLLTQAFVPGMRDRGFGRLIFVSNSY